MSYLQLQPKAITSPIHHLRSFILNFLTDQLTIRLLIHMSNPIICLLINSRPSQLGSNFIPMYQNAWLCLEESIDILKAPICCLGVKEIGYGNERGADYGPDDPEFPA